MVSATISMKIKRLENVSPFHGMRGKSLPAPIDLSSETPALPGRFVTMKVRSEFLAWLRRESVRRGTFLYETCEELASEAIGTFPWRPRTKKSAKGFF